MENTWKVKPTKEKEAQNLIDELGISPMTAILLTNRGIDEPDEAKKFLACDLNDLHSPLLLKDMKKAITRIKETISKKEKIMIFGDFDVDGTTGTYILVETIKLIGGKVEHYFPNRLTDSYGLNNKAIDYAIDNGISLIVTVDCGIRGNKVINYAKGKGIDVIVTDHHEQGELLPEAKAIINPKQKGCKYPDKDLAGVGVAFKLAQALVKEYNLDFDEFSFLDMVCLGTVADIVPLKGENRILVKNGLKKLMRTGNIGLNALIDVSALRGKEIRPGHISFWLAPRINAAGRLATADEALKLFQTDSRGEAHDIAHHLNKENTERQDIQQKILEEAIQKVEDEIDLDRETCIVLADDGWHKGVIGIVASKIVEEYHRPTILIAIEGNIGSGSGRSIPNFHLLDAIESCKELFEKYGGHTQAAGIKMDKKNIGKLRKKINEYAKKIISVDDLIPKINLDAQLKIWEVNEKLVKEIDKLTPFGIGNPKPVFFSTNLSLKDYPRILKEKHIRMKLYDHSETIDAIGFNMAGFYDDVTKNSGSIAVAYSPEINEWEGNKTMNLVLKDIKVR
jgi:single-stranded-DNA-specific exonuclease